MKAIAWPSAIVCGVAIAAITLTTCLGFSLPATILSLLGVMLQSMLPAIYKGPGDGT